MLFSSAAGSLSPLLTQIGRSDRGCSDSICLEVLTNPFIQIVAVSVLLNRAVHIITSLNCAGVNVYKRWFTRVCVRDLAEKFLIETFSKEETK